MTHNTSQIDTLPLFPVETGTVGIPTPPAAVRPLESVTGPRHLPRVGTAQQTEQLDIFTALIEITQDNSPALTLYTSQPKTHLTDDDNNRDWMKEGNCVVPKGLPRDIKARMIAEVDAALYPDYDDDTPADWSNGRELCHGCPVAMTCLRYAVATKTDEGMFGGMTPDERATWQRLNISPDRERCGTRSRYNAGCRCPECAAANAAYIARHKRQLKETAA